MIQVREVFQLQFGRAREAIDLVQRLAATQESEGGVPSRILTDLTGEYYTLVLESEHESLAAFEQSLQKGMSSPAFRELYPRFTALAKGGRREIYRIVGPPAANKVDASIAGGAVVGAP